VSDRLVAVVDLQTWLLAGGRPGDLGAHLDALAAEGVTHLWLRAHLLTPDVERAARESNDHADQFTGSFVVSRPLVGVSSRLVQWHARESELDALGTPPWSVSVHAVEDCSHAAKAGCHRLVAGSVFAPRSKPGVPASLGLGGLARLCDAAGLPVVAVGGITAANAPHCLDAGAAGVAVLTPLSVPGGWREVPALRGALRH
jgi:hypothetical protein